MTETIFVTVPENIDENQDLINPEIIGKVISWKSVEFQAVNQETQAYELKAADRVLVAWAHAPSPAFIAHESFQGLYLLNPRIYAELIDEAWGMGEEEACPFCGRAASDFDYDNDKPAEIVAAPIAAEVVGNQPAAEATPS
jgi:hypothetical protein